MRVKHRRMCRFIDYVIIYMILHVHWSFYINVKCPKDISCKLVQHVAYFFKTRQIFSSQDIKKTPIGLKSDL